MISQQVKYNTVDTTKTLIFCNVATCFDILKSSSGQHSVTIKKEDIKLC